MKVLLIVGRIPLALLIWVIALAAVFAVADTATASLDTATLISLIWGIVSVFIFKVIPANDGPMVLISYAAPLLVVVLVVLIVDGTSGWSWSRFVIDVAVAYGANQALFQAAKHTVPATVA